MLYVKRRRLNIDRFLCRKRYRDEMDEMDHPITKKIKLIIPIKKIHTRKLPEDKGLEIYNKKQKTHTGLSETHTSYICLVHNYKYICNIYDCCGITRRLAPEQNSVSSYIA